MTKIQLTQELVKSLFDYKDGFLYWKIMTCKNGIKNVGDLAGGMHTYKHHNRRKIRIGKNIYFASRLIFLYHKGWLPKMVDHKDRNTENDKIENLRPATALQNTRNRRSEEGSTSKYLGVCACGKKWRAEIKSRGNEKFLGYFNKEEDAAKAYNEAAHKIYGNFANLNVIK